MAACDGYGLALFHEYREFTHYRNNPFRVASKAVNSPVNHKSKATPRKEQFPYLAGEIKAFEHAH